MTRSGRIQAACAGVAWMVMTAALGLLLGCEDSEAQQIRACAAMCGGRAVAFRVAHIPRQSFDPPQTHPVCECNTPVGDGGAR